MKETPVFSAIRSGNIDILNQLLLHGAYSDIKNKFDETPITYALKQEHFHMAELIETFQTSSLYKQHIKKIPLGTLYSKRMMIW